MAPLATQAVLFVDDDEAATKALIRSLVRNGAEFQCHQASSAAQALESLTQLKPDAVVIDLSLDPLVGPKSGLALLTDIMDLDSSVRVLVLTAHEADNYGIEALQLGAASFISKPADTRHLLALLRDACSYSALRRRHDKLSSNIKSFEQITGLTSRSDKMLKAIESVAYASTNLQPVLLCGETGTGKGVLARAIHAAGTRQSAPFIRFQPTFGGADLITSELFGHQKGAFTGALENRKGLIEEANNGTLFIDEVDELPNETQVLLLNVLQEKVFRPLGSNKELRSNFRLIAATNRPVSEILESGALRADFYHRIAHLTIDVPPLAERREDIPTLAETFLQLLVDRENLLTHAFTPQAIGRLKSASWPGNVRQLQAVVEGGAYRAHFHKRHFIEPGDLQLSAKTQSSSGSASSFRNRVKLFEKQLVLDALRRHNNNQVHAAKSLQLDRSTFRRILRSQ